MIKIAQLSNKNQIIPAVYWLPLQPQMDSCLLKPDILKSQLGRLTGSSSLTLLTVGFTRGQNRLYFISTSQLKIVSMCLFSLRVFLCFVFRVRTEWSPLLPEEKLARFNSTMVATAVSPKPSTKSTSAPLLTVSTHIVNVTSSLRTHSLRRSGVHLGPFGTGFWLRTCLPSLGCHLWGLDCQKSWYKSMPEWPEKKERLNMKETPDVFASIPAKVREPLLFWNSLAVIFSLSRPGGKKSLPVC